MISPQRGGVGVERRHHVPGRRGRPGHAVPIRAAGQFGGGGASRRVVAISGHPRPELVDHSRQGPRQVGFFVEKLPRTAVWPGQPHGVGPAVVDRRCRASAVDHPDQSRPRIRLRRRLVRELHGSAERILHRDEQTGHWRDGRRCRRRAVGKLERVTRGGRDAGQHACTVVGFDGVGAHVVVPPAVADLGQPVPDIRRGRVLAIGQRESDPAATAAMGLNRGNFSVLADLQRQVAVQAGGPQSSQAGGRHGGQAQGAIGGRDLGLGVIRDGQAIEAPAQRERLFLPLVATQRIDGVARATLLARPVAVKPLDHTHAASMLLRPERKRLPALAARRVAPEDGVCRLADRKHRVLTDRGRKAGIGQADAERVTRCALRRLVGDRPSGGNRIGPTGEVGRCLLKIERRERQGLPAAAHGSAADVHAAPEGDGIFDLAQRLADQVGGGLGFAQEAWRPVVPAAEAVHAVARRRRRADDARHGFDEASAAQQGNQDGRLPRYRAPLHARRGLSHANPGTDVQFLQHALRLGHQPF